MSDAIDAEATELKIRMTQESWNGAVAILAEVLREKARYKKALESIDLQSRDFFHHGADAEVQLAHTVDAIGRIGIAAREALNGR